MSRGTQENERVRKQITLALFELMREKPASAITVSDIIRRADVARASYYRNFSSKEEIIQSAMDKLRGQLISIYGDLPKDEFMLYENAVQGFEIALSHFLLGKSYVLAVYDNGYASLLQELINEYAEEAIGDMTHTSIERYQLYYLSGAVFNVLIQWLKNGAIESPHEMAKICADIMCEPILHKKRP